MARATRRRLSPLLLLALAVGLLLVSGPPVYAQTGKVSFGLSGTGDASISVPLPETVEWQQFQEKASLEAYLTDPAANTRNNVIPTADATWKWYRGNTLISGATERTYSPVVAADVGHYITVEATYRLRPSYEKETQSPFNYIHDLEGPEKTVRYTSVNPVQAFRDPTTNNVPSFPSTSYTRSVLEKKSGYFGAPMDATDPDGDILTYTVRGRDASIRFGVPRFVINNASGRLGLAPGVKLNYGERYEVEVRAYDSSANNTGANTDPQVTVETTVIINVVRASPPAPQPLLQVQLTGDPDPVATGDHINYRLTATNAGAVGLTGVFWGSPELGVARRSIGDGRLAVGESESVQFSFGPVTEAHRPGPIMVSLFGESDQTDPVWTRNAVDIVAAAPMTTDTPPPSEPGLTMIVNRNRYAAPDTHLGHNIPDLWITRADGSSSLCGFLTHYEAMGGLPGWGFAVSEVLQEQPGRLTQYFQRGVLDCRLSDGRVERRLVWDYLGGGMVGAPDLGVEPDHLSRQPGRELGPWGHRVSDYAVDGTFTGFLDFFDATGGADFYGYPKTDARYDGSQGAELYLPEAITWMIRQYFQAAVLEYHPWDASQPIKLALLGDRVRDRIYPNGAYEAFASFGTAAELMVGDAFTPERTVVPPASEP